MQAVRKRLVEATSTCAAALCELAQTMPTMLKGGIVLLAISAALHGSRADADLAPPPGFVPDYPPGLTAVNASAVVPSSARAPGGAPPPVTATFENVIVQVSTAVQLYNAINEGVPHVEITDHLDLTKLPTANEGFAYPKHFDHTKLKTLRVRTSGLASAVGAAAGFSLQAHDVAQMSALQPHLHVASRLLVLMNANLCKPVSVLWKPEPIVLLQTAWSANIGPVAIFVTAACRALLH